MHPYGLIKVFDERSLESQEPMLKEVLLFSTQLHIFASPYFLHFQSTFRQNRGSTTGYFLAGKNMHWLPVSIDDCNHGVQHVMKRERNKCHFFNILCLCLFIPNSRRNIPCLRFGAFVTKAPNLYKKCVFYNRH